MRVLIFLCLAAFVYGQDCGQSPLYPDSGRNPQLGKKVVGGWEARPGEFPYQALLLYFGSAFCGGFLIDAQTVLTAAHCTAGDPAENHSILLGEQVRDDDGGDGALTAEYGCSAITEHEDYSGISLANDIAIMTIDGSVTFNDYVQPVCLPEANSLFDGMQAIVSGWGTVNSGGSMTDELRAADVLVITDEECGGNGACMEGEIDESMVCAGTCGDNDHDTCQGDSGGPMAIKVCADGGCDQGGTWTVVGITSWGYGCAASTPGVYAEVSHFIDWLNDNMP